MRVSRASLVELAAGSLPVRCLRRFGLINGRNRSIAIAGQAFLTLIPLVIITASATGSSVGERMINRFELTGDSAAAVRQLFARPPGAANAFSLLSVVVLLFSLLSLTRSLQSAYEAAWSLPPRGLPGAAQGLTGLSFLVAQLIVLALLTSSVRGLPAGSLLSEAIRFIAAIPTWLLLQYLMLSRRVPLHVLLPGAVVVGSGQVLVSAGSAVWMPRMVATDAARYGLIGVTFALISWLIVLSLLAVAGAVVAAELAGVRMPDVTGTAPSDGDGQPVPGGQRSPPSE